MKRERLNTIIGKHKGYSKVYKWYIPRAMSHVRVGDEVLVRTKHGEQMVKIVAMERVEESLRKFKHMVVA